MLSLERMGMRLERVGMAPTVADSLTQVRQIARIAGHPERGEALVARIEAAWPAMGSEIEPGETIPAETGITGVAVSFTKGCYPGQELVERMDSRGSSAPRLLQVVDAPAGASPGEVLVRDGEHIGTLTSVAGGRALALVKRSALAG